MIRKLHLLAICTVLAGAGAAGPALSAGDAARGESAVKICAACHSFEAGKKKIGPSLHGVVGRKAGSDEGFKYKQSLIDAGKKGLVWDEAQLAAFLKNPKNFLKEYLAAETVKTSMVTKVSNEQKRKDIAAYLATLK